MSLPNMANTAANTTGYHRPRIFSRRLNGAVWQVVCYYDASTRVVVAFRRLGQDWQSFTYDGNGGRPSLRLDTWSNPEDSHNNTACAIDSNGFVHFTWMGSRLWNDGILKYRRSQSPIWDWDGLVTANLQMTGYAGESEYNYPCFFKDPTGQIYYQYREGNSTNSNIIINKYNAETQAWAGFGATNGLIVRGKGVSPNRGTYKMSVPYFTPDWDNTGNGRMWISWNWRIKDGGGNVADYENVNAIYYEGGAWKNHDGTAQTIPATTANVGNPVVLARPSVEGWWPGTNASHFMAKDQTIVVAHAHRVLDPENAMQWISTRDLSWAVDGVRGTVQDIAYTLNAFVNRVRDRFDYLMFRSDAPRGFAFAEGGSLGDWGAPQSLLENYDWSDWAGSASGIDHYLLQESGRLSAFSWDFTAGSSAPVRVADSFGVVLPVPIPKIRRGGQTISGLVRNAGQSGYKTFSPPVVGA